MLTALIRMASAALVRCQLHFRRREPIDIARALQQQRAYAEALAAAGARVIELPPLDDLPDSVFVEDPAVVLDEVAIMGRMGAASRQPEVAPLADLLAEFRPLRFLEAPGTLEGGDVVRAGRLLLVGLSPRTNREGVEQFAAIAGEYGYTVRPVPVRGALHLKTAATVIGERTLLVNPDWVDRQALAGFELLPVPAEEPWAADTLTVNRTVLLAASAPRTRELLEARGLATVAVDVSEFEKAEAAVTCLSLLFDTP